MEKIPWLDSGIIRGGLLALGALIGLLASMFGVDEAMFAAKWTRAIDPILTIVATVATLYIMWKRSHSVTPPITDTAKAKTDERIEQTKTVSKETGHAQRDLLISIATFISVVLLIGIVMSSAGCGGTLRAYQQADTLEDQAKVLGEHYNSLQREAIALKAIVPANALKAMQRGDKEAAVAVVAVLRASEAYREGQSAQTQLELQQAIDKAAKAILTFSDAVNRARGAQPKPDAGGGMASLPWIYGSRMQLYAGYSP